MAENLRSLQTKNSDYVLRDLRTTLECATVSFILKFTRAVSIDGQRYADT